MGFEIITKNWLFITPKYNGILKQANKLKKK